MCWSTALLGGRTLGWWWACERQRSADFFAAPETAMGILEGARAEVDVGSSYGPAGTRKISLKQKL